jgi:glycosyltransferase involved in cell wall biosynthesis
MRLAAAVKPGLRVIFLGKGTREAQDDILRRFDGAAVEVTNLGLCELEEVGRVLRECDAMLCVRGKLNPRRASALAGIACGVPIIAYSGAAEGTALAEAGVEFVAEGDADGLGRALVHILTDGAHWQHLHERSVRVHRDHFSWDSIATSLIRFLNEPRPAQ